MVGSFGHANKKMIKPTRKVATIGVCVLGFTLDKKLGLINNRPRRDLIRYVADRPGHDRRYALNTAKISKELLWEPKLSFEEGIEQTIDWYLHNFKWVEDILDGSYMAYYRKQYGERLNGTQ